MYYIPADEEREGLETYLDFWNIGMHNNSIPLQLIKVHMYIQLSASSVLALISSLSEPTHTHTHIHTYTQAVPATKSLLMGFNIKR